MYKLLSLDGNSILTHQKAKKNIRINPFSGKNSLKEVTGTILASSPVTTSPISPNLYNSST